MVDVIIQLNGHKIDQVKETVLYWKSENKVSKSVGIIPLLFVTLVSVHLQNLYEHPIFFSTFFYCNLVWVYNYRIRNTM